MLTPRPLIPQLLSQGLLTSRALPPPQGTARGSLHVNPYQQLGWGGGRGGGALPATAAPQLRGGLWNRHKWGVCFHLCPFYWVLHSTLIDTSPPSPEKKNWTFAGRDPLTWYSFDFSVGLARELFSHMSDPQEKADQLKHEGLTCAEGLLQARHVPGTSVCHCIIVCPLCRVAITTLVLHVRKLMLGITWNIPVFNKLTVELIREDEKNK